MNSPGRTDSIHTPKAIYQFMPIPVKFSPARADFGAVAGGGRHSATVTIPKTPSAATVTFTITDDTSGGLFRIASVRVFDITVVAPGGHPELDLVSETDGVTPVSVDEAQLLTVRIDFSGPDSPPVDTFSAKLHITGKGFITSANWALITVHLFALAGQIDTVLDELSITIAQGEQGDLPIRVTSLLGPGTEVDFSLFAQPGVAMTPLGVTVPRGQTVPAKMHFTVTQDAPLGSRPLSIFVNAFNSQQSDLLKPAPTLIVIPGKPLIDGSIQWKQANPFGILVKPGDKDAWNTGRVVDAISLGSGVILAGTDSGGAWIIASTGAAVPQSNDWDDPDVNCLERGPDGPNHFYAGCGLRGTLFESDPATAFLGFIKWRQVPIVDAVGNAFGTGAIFRIAVLQPTRKIVLACQGGVFWANIPPHGANYTFKQVSSLPAGAYSSVAVGPNNSVAVASRGDFAKHSGIFFGDWSAGDLLIAGKAVINPPGLESRMGWTSLASCQSDRNVMYAATSDSKGVLLSVMRSASTRTTPAGQIWSPCNVTAEAAPPGKNILNSTGDDTFGGFRKTINVSPFDSKTVAIGWGRAFISVNSGDSWKPIGLVPGTTDWQPTAEGKVHLHEDVHAVVFDADNNGQLYVISDGGVAMTPDLGTTCFSQYNSQLANLEFTGQPRHPGTSYGAFGVSPLVAGLVGGGLQDNGDVYCRLDPTPTPWLPFGGGGDGQLMLFLTTGQLIWFDNNNHNISTAKWDGTQFTGSLIIPVRSQKPGTPALSGLTVPVVEIISTPHFRSASSKKLMFAVGSPLGGNDVYGLFGEDDGTDLHWAYLASVPINPSKIQIWALGSRNGHNIFVGTQDGRIFAMSGSGQSTLELFVAPRDKTPGAVTRFAIESDFVAFAVYDTASTPLILQMGPLRWDAMGSGQPGVAAGRGLPTDEGSFYAMEFDRTTSPKTLFVATDSNVYVSRNKGDSWQVASLGLPKRPHPADMRFVAQPDGAHFLYLSTYGRSLWRARL